jgi:hypothetical protein
MKQWEKCLAGFLITSGFAVACEDGFVDPVEVEMLPEPECSFRTCLSLDPYPDAADILFVIDDGPAMATAQQRVRDAMPAFAEILAKADRQLDVRIGFVRGGMEHPACDAATGGVLELPAECGLEGAWIDWALGVEPPDVDAMADALACAMPMRTDGCAFQSPLGAIEAAIGSAFFRDNAAASIVVVTDSFDCSPGPNPDAFDPEGQRALWSDPEAIEPTPAVCWRGGTQCWSNDAGEIERCESAERDELGVRTTNASEATLEPVDRLAETIGGLFAWKAAREQQLLLIGGVPQGFAIGDGLSLVASDDPFYGIEPGCDANDVVARPPLRQLELLDAVARDGYTDVSAVSICRDDLRDPLVELASGALENAAPNCVPTCVADVDRSASGLQPSCEFVYMDPERVEWLLPSCEDGVLPDGPPVCIELRMGEALDPSCAEAGWNLQAEVVWSGPATPGATILPICELSDDRDRDCPGLPG